LRTGSKAAAIIFIALLAFFLYGLTELFQMRFSSGDIYPPYSSLRADPIGTKAYYDALDEIPGLSVSRNFNNIPKLEGNASFLLLGTDKNAVYHIEEKEVELLEAFVLKGGRLVMTFVPARPEKRGEKPMEKEQQKKSERKKLISLADRWGFAIGSADKELVRGVKREAALASVKYRLPQNISWHSPIFFDKPSRDWESIYESAGRPVVIEKKYGKGTIVLATDTYFASNEAILKERYPELLAWLVGPHKNIIFDETHLGIYKNPSMAELFRKYRLHGVFGGFLLLAVLFVWKNSRSLAPPFRNNETDNNMSSGKDYLSGFVSLLRRNIPARNILAVSAQEWKKSLRKGSISEDKTERIDKIAGAFADKSAKKEEQVNAYRLINKILSEKMTHGKQD
jgi:hypothetical protein